MTCSFSASCSQQHINPFPLLRCNLPMHLCLLVLFMKHLIKCSAQYKHGTPDPGDVTKGQDRGQVCPIVLPSVMPGLITLSVRRALSVCTCVNCVCTFNTDSPSTCGPQLPAGFRVQHGDRNGDPTRLSLSYKLCFPLIWNFLQYKLNITSNLMKENTSILYSGYMMNGHCVYL